MNPRRWQAIQAAFDELVALDEASRASRLAALGSTDPALRAAVESLLAADAQADRRLAPLEAGFLSQAGPPHDSLGLASHTISHFQVLEPLGAGGMGVVYRAEDTRLGRAVALKFLLPQLSLDAAAKARFLHEAHSAAALDHPNLCTIYEVGESDDGRLFLAMALYPGETLKARLAREGPLTVEQALAIARQIAEGLACAHAAGIVHRDLKPGNVMLLPDGAVKILDFGLAKARDQSVTDSGTRLGTVSYMAPEQIRGEAVDARADLWALGVVLYEMLTGRKPFGGEHEVAMAHAIVHDEPVPPTTLRSHVPAAVEEVILTLLDKAPARRHARAEELVDKLAALAPIAESAARPLRTWSLRVRHILRGKRRRTVVVGAALTAGVVGALGLAVGWWDAREVGGGAPAIRSLVVLPLDNLTGDTEQEYFVDGMHEALIAELSKISALKVASRTSAMHYKGTRKPPAPAIARELGVDGLIEGSVAREADQVRITVQLIHGSTDRNLWARSYQRELRGILALQRDVAAEIARQVKVTLTPAEEMRLAGARAVHPVAYDLYLRGRHFKHMEDHWVDFYDQAFTAFEQSVAIDSGFAPAWAGLAMIYVLQSLVPVPDLALVDRARPAVARALVLDPNLSDAYVSLALVRQFLDWDWKGAENAFRRALELDPSNWEAHYEYGQLLKRLARRDEALAEMQRGLALDPLSATVHAGLIQAHAAARRYDAALAAAQRALHLHPSNPTVQNSYANALWLAGRTREAEEAWKRYYGLCCAMSETEFGNLLDTRFRRYLASGENRQALAVVREMETAPPETYSPFELARRYAELGDKDHALGWLERSVERRHAQIVNSKIDPRFDFLRGEPRFQALLEKIGLDR